MRLVQNAVRHLRHKPVDFQRVTGCDAFSQVPPIRFNMYLSRARARGRRERRRREVLGPDVVGCTEGRGCGPGGDAPRGGGREARGGRGASGRGLGRRPGRSRRGDAGGPDGEHPPRARGPALPHVHLPLLRRQHTPRVGIRSRGGCTQGWVHTAGMGGYTQQGWVGTHRGGHTQQGWVGTHTGGSLRRYWTSYAVACDATLMR